METSTKEVVAPKGALTFKAVRVEDEGRVNYIGAMPVYDLIDKNFVVPVASLGLSPELLKKVQANGGGLPVQRKTTPSHVQGIVDYIVEQAEKGDPWAFNAVVLYSTNPDSLTFATSAEGITPAGEVRAEEAFSVGEGLHRCLAWAVALDLANVRGVKRPEMSAAAAKRISLATIPVVLVVESNLNRQKVDFNKLNRQKALNPTVLGLTDDSLLSDLTRDVIADVRLFQDRIDHNNASASSRSDKLLSFAQLRFVVASYLLGKDTRSPAIIEAGVTKIVDKRGEASVRAELREVFLQVATRLGGLERLHNNRAANSGELVRKLRTETLLASNGLWRALMIALHEAKASAPSVDAKTALVRLSRSRITWARDDAFFKGSLIEPETGKLVAVRENIHAAADKFAAVMVK